MGTSKIRGDTPSISTVTDYNDVSTNYEYSSTADSRGEASCSTNDGDGSVRPYPAERSERKEKGARNGLFKVFDYELGLKLTQEFPEVIKHEDMVYELQWKGCVDGDSEVKKTKRRKVKRGRVKVIEVEVIQEEVPVYERIIHRVQPVRKVQTIERPEVELRIVEIKEVEAEIELVEEIEEVVNISGVSVPVPVEAEVEVSFSVPKITARPVIKNFPIYLPRFVEVPVVKGTKSEHEAMVEINEMVAIATGERGIVASLCHLEETRNLIKREDLVAKHLSMKDALRAPHRGQGLTASYR